MKQYRKAVLLRKHGETVLLRKQCPEGKEHKVLPQSAQRLLCELYNFSVHSPATTL